MSVFLLCRLLTGCSMLEGGEASTQNIIRNIFDCGYIDSNARKEKIVAFFVDTFDTVGTAEETNNSMKEPTELKGVLAGYSRDKQVMENDFEISEKVVQYINSFYFSKKHIQHQMINYDGYDSRKVQNALDTVVVDWNKVAMKSAERYLENGNFSKQGLFYQLTSSDGGQFTVEEAQYAIDNIDVDWKKEALGAAKDYLSWGHFSERSLFRQLTSASADEFTSEEARYAIDNIQANWNQEALESAKSYYDTGITDLKKIYDQLISDYGEQFTSQQARYAIDHFDSNELDAP